MKRLDHIEAMITHECIKSEAAKSLGEKTVRFQYTLNDQLLTMANMIHGQRPRSVFWHYASTANTKTRMESLERLTKDYDIYLNRSVVL